MLLNLIVVLTNILLLKNDCIVLRSAIILLYLSLSKQNHILVFSWSSMYPHYNALLQKLIPALYLFYLFYLISQVFEVYDHLHSLLLVILVIYFVFRHIFLIFLKFEAWNNTAFPNCCYHCLKEMKLYRNQALHLIPIVYLTCPFSHYNFQMESYLPFLLVLLSHLLFH